MNSTLEMFTEDFKNKLENVIEEEGYDYKKMISCTGVNLYKGTNEEIIKAHINHISEDYKIDDGLELVLSNGYIKDEAVYAELLMRKKKES